MYFRYTLGVLAFALLLAAPVLAGIHRESVYQGAWCVPRGGELEVVLGDGTRVDCLMDEYAVEVDFARKWAEAIGQAMHYSRLTGRPPGVLLIMEKPGDAEHLNRLRETAYWIRVWTITPEEVP